MKIQEKPDYLIFAESAKKGEVSDFPDVSRGWGVTIEQTGSKPPMEWMNGAFNRVDKNTLYLLQQGVPEWSESVKYPVNAIIKYNGVLYTAIVENDNAKPATSTTKWKKTQAEVSKASTTQSGIVKLSSEINSTSETEAATPKAVKSAYDLASGAVKKSGDGMTGQLQFSPTSYGIKFLHENGNELVMRPSGDSFIYAYYNSKSNTWTNKLRYVSNGNTWRFENVDDVTINNKSVLKTGDGGLFSRAPLLASGTDLLSDDILSVSQSFTLAGNYINSPISGITGTLTVTRRYHDAGAGATLEINQSNNKFYKATAHKTKDGWVLHGWVEQITTANVADFLPVGIPQPWPTTTPPDGWLKCNGWKFDKNKYPKLATVYPSGNLPDLRGEFIRGWDDGKGTDPGRGILSWQGDAIRNIYGSTSTIQFYSQVLSNGAFGHDVLSSSGGHVGESWRGTNVALNFDASRIVPTSHDNHPRNLAFMYIVKAE